MCGHRGHIKRGGLTWTVSVADKYPQCLAVMRQRKIPLILIRQPISHPVQAEREHFLVSRLAGKMTTASSKYAKVDVIVTAAPQKPETEKTIPLFGTIFHHPCKAQRLLEIAPCGLEIT